MNRISYHVFEQASNVFAARVVEELHKFSNGLHQENDEVESAPPIWLRDGIASMYKRSMKRSLLSLVEVEPPPEAASED